MSEGSFPKGFLNCFPRDRPLKQRPTNLSLCGSFLKISVLRDHTALNGDLLSQLPQCSCTMYNCEVVTGHCTRFETEATGPSCRLRIFVDRFLSGLVHRNSGKWMFISQLNRESTIEKVVVQYWASFLQTCHLDTIDGKISCIIDFAQGKAPRNHTPYAGKDGEASHLLCQHVIAQVEYQPSLRMLSKRLQVDIYHCLKTLR